MVRLRLVHFTTAYLLIWQMAVCEPYTAFMLRTFFREQEAPLRLMLARTLERSVGRASDEPPLRQKRRQPMIEAALVPLEPRLSEGCFKRLVQALSMIVGAEGFITLSDVVGLDEKEARRVRHWAIKVLLAAALPEP